MALLVVAAELSLSPILQVPVAVLHPLELLVPTLRLLPVRLAVGLPRLPESLVVMPLVPVVVSPPLGRPL